jgi:hypothetical protein
MKFRHLLHLELEVVQNQPVQNLLIFCPFTPIIPYNGTLVDWHKQWQQNLKDPISTASEDILFFVSPPPCVPIMFPKIFPIAPPFFNLILFGHSLTSMYIHCKYTEGGGGGI